MNDIMALTSWFSPLIDWPDWAVFLCKITAILAIAWLAHFALWRLHARWRTLVWRGAAIGICALAVSSLFDPHWPARVVRPKKDRPSGSTTIITSSAQSSTYADSIAIGQSMPADAGRRNPQPGIANYDSATKLAVGQTALIVWLIGAGMLGFRYLLGRRAIAELIGASQTAPPELIEALHKITRGLGYKPALAVRISADCSSTLIAGWANPLLILPEKLAAKANTAEFRSILAHEIAHAKSGDVFWNELVHCITYLLWFHPLAWRIPAAHMLACEKACDTESVKATGDARAYQRTLARAALERPLVAVSAAAIPLARHSTLGQRLAALERPLRGAGPRRLSWVCASVLFIAASVCLGSMDIAPRGESGLYEKGPGSKDLKIQVGPNVLGIRTVTRSASLSGAEDGKGNSVTIEGIDPMTQIPDWIDMAEIDLDVDPELLDVMEVRVFDHETKELIQSKGLRMGVGWEFDAKHSRARVWSLGAHLPDKIDLWLRANSYEEDEEIHALRPEDGATLSAGGMNITIDEIRQGRWNWSSPNFTNCTEVDGWISMHLTMKQNSALMSNQQMCAVSVDGRRATTDDFHFLATFGGSNMHIIYFPIDMSELSHFEMNLSV